MTSFKVLDDNKEMFELVGGLLCVNAVVGMRVVMNEISHQNTHRIQTNATCATIPQSHNPTHAHPQWREIARVHRMQKVIQPSWKSEHSYAHSHRGESTYLYSVKQVIDTNWKIEGAYIHRQCHCQWGHSAKLEPRADICLRTYWGEAPP